MILHSAPGTSGTAAAPFNLGRTTTHEVGHWLNLRHIWGDQNDCSGTDFVSDTPNAQLPDFGTPTFPHVSCDNGPNGDMLIRPSTGSRRRGRLAFELRPDGSYAEAAIGPADVPLDVTGTWTLDDDVLVIARDEQNEPERLLRVKAVDPDRLVVSTG